MRYGFVTVAVLDLWERPRFNSGRVHQLLFTEPVKILKSETGYALLEDTGGYRGWGQLRHIATLSASAHRDLAARRRTVVRAKQARLYTDMKRTPAEPPLLYYGTVMPVESNRRDYARIRLPDGRSVYARTSGVERTDNRSSKAVTGQKLAREAMRFVGVPYLWGGVTSNGFDCSGLVQTICRRFGLIVPRDTKDQIKIGRPVPDSDIKTGDLLFFDRHVGFAIGRDRIVHCSVAGGGVRVESLVEGAADYRADLKESFRGARRLTYAR